MNVCARCFEYLGRADQSIYHLLSKLEETACGNIEGQDQSLQICK